jgi:N-acetylmuramoyl-L-alanine amidase
MVSCGLLNLPSIGFAKSAFDYALEGQDLIQKNRFAEAVSVLKEAVRIDPANDWAYGLLGRAYHGIGNEAEAVAAFRKALRLNPNDTYSRMMTDIISQKPIPKLKKRKRPPSALELQARQEESRKLDTLKVTKDLGYQVKRVVIDAGHGGFDPGAVGKGGLKEKDVTLDLALNIHQKLMQQGNIKSFLTRTGDYYVPLSARTVTANQYQADLFISLHINASKKRASHGSETYFCSEKASSAEAEKLAAFENSVLKFDEPFKKQKGHIDIEDILFKLEQKLYWSESGKFAQTFQERFKRHLPLRSRGVHSANFYVLRRTKMPSILLETGFISNPDEEAMLRSPDFRGQIVDSIVKGLA